MARSFRFYGKKRGHRRTVSRAMAGAGEACLFAMFLVVGCGFFYWLASTWLMPAWRVNHRYVRAQCVVRDKRIAEEASEEGKLYRPEFKIEYQVDGTTYSIWTYQWPNPVSADLKQKQAVLNRFLVGREYPCWHDPSEPSSAVLVKGYNWWMGLWFAVPISFMVLGGVGLAYSVLQFGTSAERRSALARRAGGDLFVVQPDRSYPNVPDTATVTDSAGTRLAYRLPIGSSHAWLVFFLGVVCLVWNVTTWLFVVATLGSLQPGDPVLGPVLVLTPFALIGLGLLVYFVYYLLMAKGIGPTLVEISAHPLLPGRRYEVFLMQSGRLRVKSLSLLVVAEEQATFRQGTNRRTELRRVWQSEIFRREDFEVHASEPLEVQCPLEIPARAMHSFRSEHHEVRWKLMVQGQLTRWPRYHREFPLIVHPPNGSSPR